jgi:hypothetical protein
MSLKKDIINCFENIESNHTPIEVVILENNKFKFGETLQFSSLNDFADSLLADFEKGKYHFSGGSDREFYITNDKEDDFTFQVSEFEFHTDSIDLEV